MVLWRGGPQVAGPDLEQKQKSGESVAGGHIRVSLHPLLRAGQEVGSGVE